MSGWWAKLWGRKKAPEAKEAKAPPEMRERAPQEIKKVPEVREVVEAKPTAVKEEALTKETGEVRKAEVVAEAVAVKEVVGEKAEAIARKEEIVVTQQRPLGELELFPNPGKNIAEALKAEGVSYIFGVWGGHEWPWLDESMRLGINHISFGHEEQAGYAAEGYARIAGKPGVCNVTVGPGASNIVSAIQQAYGSNTPMVVITAGHEAYHDRAFALQECRAMQLWNTITKWSLRLCDSRVYKFEVRNAMRDCMIPPRGPIGLETETSALVGLVRSILPGHENYVEDAMKGPIAEPEASDADIEKVVKLLYETPKVAAFVGDGMHWHKCSPELVEFLELAQIPCLSRRGGRGAIPEVHPLSFKPASVIGESDLLLLMGHRLDFYDTWGTAWGVKKTAQINDCKEFIHPWLPTEHAIAPVNLKKALRQMIDYIKWRRLQPPAGRDAWAKHVAEVEAARKGGLRAKAEKYKSMRKPVHGGYACKAIWDTVEKRYGGKCVVIWDSFTGSNVMGPFVNARFAGSCLDSGIQAGVGHGCGQAIGAGIALREKGDNTPILAMMGDAGMHHAMDIETAVRHRIPVVYVVWNNNGWMPVCRDIWYGPNWEMIGGGGPDVKYPPHEFLPEIRYDKMFEAVGCHGEWVTEPEQIGPALERCFQAAEQGQPAVYNLMVEQSVPVQSVLASALAQVLMWWVPWEELPWRGKALRIPAGLVPDEAFKKYGIKPEDYRFDTWDPTPKAQYAPYGDKKPRPVPPWYGEIQKKLGTW